MVELKLYYATNRNHVGDQWEPDKYGSSFSMDGIENLRFGKVTLQADKQKIEDCLNAEVSDKGKGDGIKLSSYLEQQFKSTGHIKAFEEELTAEPPKYGSKDMFEEIKDRMTECTDTVIYIHGYAVSWYDAVASALSLQLMLNNKDENIENQEVLVILFTWPSDGRYVISKNVTSAEIENQKRHMSAYRSDRAEAEGSARAFARGILKLVEFFKELKDRQEICGQSIHLLCHSMGNYVLQNALPWIENYTPSSSLPRIFEHIFLCSADVDDNVLETGQPMGTLHQLAYSVSVYCNRWDKALLLSDILKGNPDRLGTNGTATTASVHKKIHQIDCTSIIGTEHSYYIYGKTNRDIRVSIASIEHNDLEKRQRKQVNNLKNEWQLV